MITPLEIGAIAARRSQGGAGGVGSDTDPYYANVVALLHFDGTDGSTTFTDQKGHTFSAAGNAQLDTAQSKFGGASLLLDGSGDYISSVDNADWELGSGDHTIELWVRWNSLPGAATISSFVTKFSGTTHAIFFGLYNNAGNKLLWDADDDNAGGQAVDIQGAWSPSTNTWYHVAASRISGVTEIYADGNRIATASDSITYHNNANALIIGASNSGANNQLNGWIDELRITKGVGRYTGTTLAIPTSAFPDS
jgi:hypothetical protein